MNLTTTWSNFDFGRNQKTVESPRGRKEGRVEQQSHVRLAGVNSTSDSLEPTSLLLFYITQPSEPESDGSDLPNIMALFNVT